MIAVLRDFDKVKDMQEVDQFGFVDLPKAYSQGVVSSDLKVETGKMNGIEHPESIFGKPSDEFDAIRMNQVVRERGTESKLSSDVKP